MGSFGTVFLGQWKGAPVVLKRANDRVLGAEARRRRLTLPLTLSRANPLVRGGSVGGASPENPTLTSHHGVVKKFCLAQTNP